MTLELIDEAKHKIDNDPDYARKPEHDKSVFEKLVAIDKKVAMVMTLDMLGAGIDTVRTKNAYLTLNVTYFFYNIFYRLQE